MKPIEVRDQVKLGPARCLLLSITGMSYRMFRSVVTVAILGLAVAFLAHMISYGLIEHQTLVEVHRELKDSRALGQWVMRLTQADSEARVEKTLASGSEEPLSEYRTWSAQDTETFETARRSADRLARVHDYLDSLPAASQAILMTGLESRQMLERLRRPGQLENFARHLDELKLEPPLDNLEDFRKLVREELPVLEETVKAIREGQRRAIRTIQETYPGRSATALLAECPKDLPEKLSGVGFVLEGDELSRLSGLAREREQFERVSTAINLPETKTEIASELGVNRTKVGTGMVLMRTDSTSEATWLSELLSRHGVEGVSAEDLLRLARAERRFAKLQAAVGDEPPVTGGGFAAISRWTMWLIALSFLVCTVGVANAMFMSVTERFTEIATMKCLGALDGFLMMLFLFESGMQGLVGALGGVVFGVVLAGVRGLLMYGTLVHLPWIEMLIGCGICVVSGLVLAVLGGVGPAWAAARLAPMEAMRIE